VLAAAAIAQTPVYPSKPIRLVVPYPAGGPLDAAARALAEHVKGTLGTVVIDNRPGAGGNLGVDLVAKSAPDGYTLVIGAVATHAVNPWLFRKLPYDPVKDFAPITLAYLQRNPGKLNYASGGNGSAGHMAGELLKSQARLSAVHIPYTGAAPAQLGLLGGQTDFMFDNLASALPQIRGGKLKALAVTTPQRAPALPDVPTMAESGVPGFDVSTWFGVFAPAGTPPAIVARLNEALTAALRTPEMAERLARMGAEPAPTTPQQFAELVARELAKYQKVVQFSGARVD
jgi:tripartite-type tricarboxylate transporter receptor subunit TctC